MAIFDGLDKIKDGVQPVSMIKSLKISTKWCQNQNKIPNRLEANR